MFIDLGKKKRENLDPVRGSKIDLNVTDDRNSGQLAVIGERVV